MKAQYNRDDDVLILEMSDAAIDHAEESDGIIVHFSQDGRLAGG